MRVLLRSRTPVVALLLLAPAIPELLTGSTPVSLLLLGPLPALSFVARFAGDIALYGTGALLIREFAVVFRKGWPSILLLGAAYGIAEEGFAVHTFFQITGPPVGALGSYGHAFGVNWVWALGLTAFHATYSIALPILLCSLWFPEVRGSRWLDRGALVLTGAVYLGIVVLFALVTGHGPTPGALVLFLAVEAVLLASAWKVPADLFPLSSGPTRASRLGLAVAGTGGFAAWVVALAFATGARVPAVLAGVEIVAVNLGVLAYLLRRVGRLGLERAEFDFATGMLVALFVWDVPVEFSVPGVLGVAAIFAFLQYRLGARIERRSSLRPGTAETAARGPSP